MHYKKSVFRSLALVTQLGFCVITPVFICIFAGYQLDQRFGTKTLIPLLIIGILAGAKSAWDLVKKVLRQEQEEAAAEDRQRYKVTKHTGITKPKESSRIKSASQQPKEESDE